MQLKPQDGMIFRCSKTYGHNIGLSCCFRQWRAKSHCRFMHGYALKVHLEFSTQDLDSNNWVVDFGALKPVKAWLEKTFDHKTLVAKDDPLISTFREMAIAGLIQLVEVESVGVEAFAYLIYNWVNENVIPDFPNASLNKVSVHEHDGNGAEYGRTFAGVRTQSLGGDVFHKSFGTEF